MNPDTRHRAVLAAVMRYFGGALLAEIGQRLSCGPEQARILVLRGLRDGAEWLAEERRQLAIERRERIAELDRITHDRSAP